MFTRSTDGRAMKPEAHSKRLLGATRAKAKMWEYSVPEEAHIKLEQNPESLFDISIGMLGDLAAAIASETDIETSRLEEMQVSLRFASQFFEAHQGGRINTALDDYTTICAAACYYLSDMPGAAAVLTRSLSSVELKLEAGGLDRLLLGLLPGGKPNPATAPESQYARQIQSIEQGFRVFFDSGTGREALIENAQEMRRKAYASGTPRELLFADVVTAVLLKRVLNSAWVLLPKYSGLPLDRWSAYLHKANAIRELWPSQRLLGDKGLLEGASAVVQMPTSAGKTRAAELIIRSAFLAHRATLAVLVAPYRALCHEISIDLRNSFVGEGFVVTELTDVPQDDEELLDAMPGTVLVMTPEKLAYVLRHRPELVESMGLLIYDEAHLFDSPTRGVNYELLLSYVKEHLDGERQTILISAVMSNAEDVAGWLLDSPEATVSGALLAPTVRTVAYASWKQTLLRLQFPVIQNVQDFDFFVPRVLRAEVLRRRRRGFPDAREPGQIALCLGLKLAQNGGVAVFCGTKASANKIAKGAIDAFERGLSLPAPVQFSDVEEISKLRELMETQLGSDATVAGAAKLGVLVHHAGVPQGIRRAIEHALRNERAPLVVCTSTLAQGVNLPIRYLIVSSVHQGRSPMMTRDFHNLMGRAGRAGKFSEGSIIFADPSVYDERAMGRDGRRRWKKSLELLDPGNSEDCGSAIQLLLNPIKSDNGWHEFPADPLTWVSLYIEEPERFIERGLDMTTQHDGYSESDVRSQLVKKLNVIAALESFLLVQLQEMRTSGGMPSALIEQTLAYALSDDEGRAHLVQAMEMLAEHIEANVKEPERQAAYGRSLLGLRDCQRLDAWVCDNRDKMLQTSDPTELARLLWPVFESHIDNSVFSGCQPREALPAALTAWIGGQTYERILRDQLSGCAVGKGDSPSTINLEQVVDLCEQAFSFEGTVLIAALTEILTLQVGAEAAQSTAHHLNVLQRRMKYGLPTQTAISVHELGLSDRVVAQEVASVIGGEGFGRTEARFAMRLRSKRLQPLLDSYPSYFREKFEELSAKSSL